MIKQPICDLSKSPAVSFCCTRNCPSNAFICQSHQQCSARHFHHNFYWLNWVDIDQSLCFIDPTCETSFIDDQLTRQQSLLSQLTSKLNLLFETHRKQIFKYRLRNTFDSQIQHTVECLRNNKTSEITGDNMSKLIELLNSDFVRNKQDQKHNVKDVIFKFDQLLRGVEEIIKMYQPEAEEDCKQGSGGIERLKIEARGNIKEGNLRQALEDYSRVIERQPEDDESYFLRGCCYSSLKQHRQAIQDYSMAIILNPTNPDYLSNRALSYHHLSQPHLATQDLTQACTINPNNPQIYYSLAQIKISLLQYSEAVIELALAIKVNPNNAEYYHARAICYESLLNYSHAFSDYTSAINLQHFAGYYADRGHCLVKMGECEAAVEDYNRAIHIQPENAEYYRRRAEVLDRMGRYSEAEANRSIAADLTH